MADSPFADHDLPPNKRARLPEAPEAEQPHNGRHGEHQGESDDPGVEANHSDDYQEQQASFGGSEVPIQAMQPSEDPHLQHFVHQSQDQQDGQEVMVHHETGEDESSNAETEHRVQVMAIVPHQNPGDSQMALQVRAEKLEDSAPEHHNHTGENEVHVQHAEKHFEGQQSVHEHSSQHFQQDSSQQVPNQQDTSQHLAMQQLPFQQQHQVPFQQIPMSQIPMQQVPMQRVTFQQMPGQQASMQQMQLQQFPMQQVQLQMQPIQQVLVQQPQQLQSGQQMQHFTTQPQSQHHLLQQDRMSMQQQPMQMQQMRSQGVIQMIPSPQHHLVQIGGNMVQLAMQPQLFVQPGMLNPQQAFIHQPVTQQQQPLPQQQHQQQHQQQQQQQGALQSPAPLQPPAQGQGQSQGQPQMQGQLQSGTQGQLQAVTQNREQVQVPGQVQGPGQPQLQGQTNLQSQAQSQMQGQPQMSQNQNNGHLQGQGTVHLRQAPQMKIHQQGQAQAQMHGQPFVPSHSQAQVSAQQQLQSQFQQGQQQLVPAQAQAQNPQQHSHQQQHQQDLQGSQQPQQPQQQQQQQQQQSQQQQFQQSIPLSQQMQPAVGGRTTQERSQPLSSVANQPQQVQAHMHQAQQQQQMQAQQQQQTQAQQQQQNQLHMQMQQQQQSIQMQPQEVLYATDPTGTAFNPVPMSAGSLMSVPMQQLNPSLQPMSAGQGLDNSMALVPVSQEAQLQLAGGQMQPPGMTSGKRQMVVQQPMMMQPMGIMGPPGGSFMVVPQNGMQGLQQFQMQQIDPGQPVESPMPPKKMQSHRFGPDGHMWRKYSHKLLQGTKTERVYYACTEKESMGCPAKKIVDRAKTRRWRGDHSGDIVTLEGQHNHPPRRFQQPSTPQPADVISRGRLSLEGATVISPPMLVSQVPALTQGGGATMAIQQTASEGQSGSATTEASEVSWLRPPANPA